MGSTVTSLYDILKARKTGLSPDLYTLLRAQREMPERVITAEPPIYFKSDGTAISEYQINGDTIQNGTPTPNSPVEVLGVGDRTANLFDNGDAVIGERVLKNSIVADEGAAHSDYIDITGISTLTVNKNYIATNFYFYADKTMTSVGYVDDFTANVPAGAKYCRINVLKDDVDTIMLNIGSTALPYEPYGYKIPITLNSVAQNVYLDSPLYEGDYIKRNADGTGVLHQDGADTPITLPQFSAVKGNNELNISTTVTPEVTLKGKIKQLPDSDMNALLSVMEEM